MSSMTIKALLHISQVHLPWRDVECRSLLANCIIKAVNVFCGGYLKAQVFTHTLPDINSLKDCECYAGHSTSRHGKCTWEMAAIPWLSWRTSPRRCIEDVRLFVNPRHWLTWHCSVVFIAVYNKCVILLSKWVSLNAAPSIFLSEDGNTTAFRNFVLRTSRKRRRMWSMWMGLMK
jgi:hypothetical protein